MHIITSGRVILPFVVGSLFASQLYAQTHDHPAPAATAAVPSAETKQAFALLKTLAGEWQGPIVEPVSKTNVKMDVSLRVTSRGNALVHEMKSAEATDNPLKNDHPVTMIYLDGASLLLTHYCDAGNRPRMSATVSPDGKQIDFDFLDLTGPTSYGHMQHVRFTLVDDTHHTEEWSYLQANGKTFTGRFDLVRVSTVASLPAK
ncbi:MAG TPA: hypothetical protein VHM30_14680 [Gemmatimonadaceae bacterium]|nr:hypothetical protein [Gemmatimonadaceae bacterium]